MKKVGIIGASGVIGSHITTVFPEHGFEVKASTADITTGSYRLINLIPPFSL